MSRLQQEEHNGNKLIPQCLIDRWFLLKLNFPTLSQSCSIQEAYSLRVQVFLLMPLLLLILLLSDHFVSCVLSLRDVCIMKGTHLFGDSYYLPDQLLK